MPHVAISRAAPKLNLVLTRRFSGLHMQLTSIGLLVEMHQLSFLKRSNANYTVQILHIMHEP